MKNLNKNIYLITFLALTILSCEKDENRVIMKQGTEPELSTSNSALVLAADNADNEALTLSWSASNFGFTAAVNYELQFSTSDTFDEMRTVAIDSGMARSYTVAQLNTLSTQLGLVPGETGNIKVRVEASLSPDVNAYSNLLTLEVTPYQLTTESPYPTVYMVGDAVENTWDANLATPMFRDESDGFTYTFTGKFNEGALKMLGELGSWAPLWGWADDATLAFRETEADEDPGSLWVPGSGYFTVKMNVNTLSYTIEPFDESSATDYASITISGDFNGWGDDALTANAFNPHIWSLAYTFADDTNLKFKIGESWDVNWGPDSNEARLYGMGVQNGGNVFVEAGSYKILFNDLTGRYIFLKQ